MYQVIGLIQSSQTAETAKNICEGLDSVVSAEEKTIKIEISLQAYEHKLKCGRPFYPSSPNSHDGIGSTYWAEIYGREAGCHALKWCGRWIAQGWVATWTNYVMQKQQVLKHYATVSLTAKSTPRSFAKA